MSNWLTDGKDFSDAESPLADRSFTPVPKGEYECEVVACFDKNIDSFRGYGVAVKVELLIIEGDHKGRKVFGSHVVEYNSKVGDDDKASTTERIGRSQYREFCSSCGFDRKPDGLGVFVGKNVKARVAIKKRQDGVEDNDITGYQRSSYLASQVSAPNIGGASPWR